MNRKRTTTSPHANVRSPSGSPVVNDLESFTIRPQPTESTCGPTCLHAVYQFHGDQIGLDEVIAGAECLDGGGTLAVFLGCHALRRGYRATLYTFNLQIFDPTWFEGAGCDLAAKLEAQVRRKPKAKTKLRRAMTGYQDFVRLGGEVRYADLTRRLIRHHLRRSTPILCGLSATYLYRCPRERPEDGEYDDLAGEPVGHFVVLCGYEPNAKLVRVADPMQSNPLTGSRYYPVPIDRVIAAILLGIITFDANLLLLEQPERRTERS